MTAVLTKPESQTQKGYCALRVYVDGKSCLYTVPVEGAPQGFRVVVFDTPNCARAFLPHLGKGRITQWSLDMETATWSFRLGAINRADILTGYDVYNLPGGLPVTSETHSMAWKEHVRWAQALAGEAGASA